MRATLTRFLVLVVLGFARIAWCDTEISGPGDGPLPEAMAQRGSYLADIAGDYQDAATSNTFSVGKDLRIASHSLVVIYYLSDKTPRVLAELSRRTAMERG